jgi:plasmid stabilization system protein ParE
VTSRLKINITEIAQQQIEDAAEWWSGNRPSAPGAVRNDLDRILGLLAVQPDMGARAQRVSLQSVRRVTLSRIRYYLYYRVSGDVLEVLAVWHTSRGDEPDL